MTEMEREERWMRNFLMEQYNFIQRNYRQYLTGMVIRNRKAKKRQTLKPPRGKRRYRKRVIKKNDIPKRPTPFEVNAAIAQLDMPEDRFNASKYAMELVIDEPEIPIPASTVSYEMQMLKTTRA